MYFEFKIFRAIFALIQGDCAIPKWEGLWVRSNRDGEGETHEVSVMTPKTWITEVGQFLGGQTLPQASPAGHPKISIFPSFIPYS